MLATNPLPPDNAVLLWLQDESNNECSTSEEATTQMYSFFDDDDFHHPSIPQHFQQDDDHHCFLIFKKICNAVPTPPSSITRLLVFLLTLEVLLLSMVADT